MARIREKLIAAGLWDSKDARDPDADTDAAETLLGNLKNWLKPGVSVIIISDPETPPVFRPMIRKVAGTHAIEMSGIVAGSAGKFKSRAGAICGAALALPAFLKQHPEFAAPIV
jgi:hypothetical protein